jgi:hypothetical protein
MTEAVRRITPAKPQIMRYLRMGHVVPDDVLAARIDRVAARVMAAVRPREAWRRTALPLDGVSSHALARHLNGCSEAFLVCGTLGAGVDALQRTVAVTSAADALIVQAVATAAVENWMDRIGETLGGTLAADETLTPRFSPGYGDFPLSYQRVLIDLLDAPRVLGVSVTPSDLLVPVKSVTAVVGIRKIS